MPDASWALGYTEVECGPLGSSGTQGRQSLERSWPLCGLSGLGFAGMVDAQGNGGDGAGRVSRDASWRGWLMHEQGRARQREATPGRGETFPPSSIRRQAERAGSQNLT